MAVHCEKCGARVASRAALPGHYRKAHGRAGRAPNRRGHAICAIVPARPKPIRAEVVPAPRPVLASKRSLTPDLRDAQRSPSWWEPQADLEWRVRQWNAFPADYRNRILGARADAAFTIRPPHAPDAVTLWSQYHALKALATRLDAGVATEAERLSFEAGLREYNANYDRIRAQR